MSYAVVGEYDEITNISNYSHIGTNFEFQMHVCWAFFLQLSQKPSALESLPPIKKFK